MASEVIGHDPEENAVSSLRQGAVLPARPPGQREGDSRGQAPKGKYGYPIELHHRGQSQDGPLDEMTRTQHRGVGNFKKNHSNVGTEKSKINRNESSRDGWFGNGNSDGGSH